METNHIDLKRQMNALKMCNYHRSLIGEKCENFLKKERLRQAAVRLKNKIGDKHHRESNRLRQQKCRMLKVVPQSPSKYHKVVKSLCKAASSSPRKKLILQNCLSSFKFESIPTPKPKLSILQLQMLRRQNRLFEHKQLVTKIKREYGSINKASLQLHVPYKTLHSLCKPLEKKRKTVCETWVNIRLFYNKEIVSHEHPSVRLKGHRFMTSTLEECFTLYKDDCKKEFKVAVSFSTFARLRPRNVYKIDQTPDRQCICDECENFRMVRRTLNRLGIKGVPVHSKECIEMSLCQINDSNADSNDNNPDSDAFHQIDPNYGRIECINRSCKECGKNLVLLTILKANPNLESNVKSFEYSQWCWQKKTARTRKLVLEKKSGTLLEIVTLFAKQLEGLAYHIFSCNWNYAQFQHVRDNLKPGFLLQVYDFGQNFMNVYQDEPQQVHWDHSQTTIHPIISYYIKPGESTITTEEHIMISDDLTHDKFAVKKFEALSLQHLKSKGITPRYIVIFSDNCKSQYKGKGTFQFHSESDCSIDAHVFWS